MVRYVAEFGSHSQYNCYFNGKIAAVHSRVSDTVLAVSSEHKQRHVRLNQKLTAMIFAHKIFAIFVFPIHPA